MTRNYPTKGWIRQRIKALARLAGLQTAPQVAFSRKEVERLCPEALKGHHKSMCSVRDSAEARTWQKFNLVWVRLPVSDDTLAHEINHLRTRGSHSTATFNNQVVALARGLDPKKAKPSWYEVTVTSVEKRRVFELSASAAKQRWFQGSVLTPPVRKVKAKKIN